MLDVGDRLANRDVFNARETHEVPRGGLLNVDAPQAIEGVELRDAGLLHLRIELADGDRVADADAPVEDPADGDAPEVVVRIEVRHEQLQGRVGASARR